jgi:hypothetical protein
LLRDQMEAFTTSSVPLVEALSRPLQPFLLEALKYVFVIPRASVLLVWIAVLAVIVLLRHHRDRSLLALLTLAGVAFVLMALLLPHRFPYYGVLLWPVFALLVARLLAVTPRRLAVVMGTTLVVVSIATIGQVVWHYLPADYDGYVARLRAQVPPDAMIQADPLLWFGFSDHPFVGSHYFVLVDSYADEVRRLGVDYVLLDVPTLGECPACAAVREESEFLPNHAELVAVVEDPYYGAFPAADGKGFTTPIYRIKD